MPALAVAAAGDAAELAGLRLLGDDRRVSADRAVVGLGTEVHRQVDTSSEAVLVLVCPCLTGRGCPSSSVHIIVGNRAIAVAVIGPYVAADLEACVGARDVEEACSVEVADFHVFDRLGLDRKISRLGARHRQQSGCGTEQKAFHLCHLTLQCCRCGRIFFRWARYAPLEGPPSPPPDEP